MKKLIFVIVLFTFSCDNSNDFVPDELALQKSNWCNPGDYHWSMFNITQYPAYGTTFQLGQYYTWKARLNYNMCPENQQYISLLLWMPEPGDCDHAVPNSVKVDFAGAGNTTYYSSENTECEDQDAFIVIHEVPITAAMRNQVGYEFTFRLNTVSMPRWECSPVWFATLAIRKEGSGTYGHIRRIEGTTDLYQNDTYAIKGLLGSNCGN